MTVRVDQLAIETLAENSAAPELRMSKVSLKVLADPAPVAAGICPCDSYMMANLDGLKVQTHRIARCWEITRTDSVTYRFTEHNRKLLLPLRDGAGSVTFSPIQGMSATAQQRLAGLEPSNYEAFGVTGSITFADMVAGYFRDAKITELVVDHRYPFLGSFRCGTHFIRKLSFDGERWEADLVGQRGRLEKPIGRVFTRNCSFKFGDVNTCGVDLPSFTQSHTVSAVDADEPLRKFTAPSAPISGFADPINSASWYQFGNVTWTTGPNTGLSMEIRAWDNTADTFELYLEMPNAIEVSDTFDATPGCDHTLHHCDGKYNNKARFGGFPFMPGPDAVIRGPGLSVEQIFSSLLHFFIDLLLPG